MQSRKFQKNNNVLVESLNLSFQIESNSKQSVHYNETLKIDKKKLDNN